MLITCCKCSREYKLELLQSKWSSSPLIQCPSCGLVHTVDFEQANFLPTKPLDRIRLKDYYLNEACDHRIGTDVANPVGVVVRAGWNTGDYFWVGIRVHNNDSREPIASDFILDWNKDGGGYTTLAAAGELKWPGVDAMVVVDDTPAVALFFCATCADNPVDGFAEDDSATVAGVDIAEDNETEVWWAIDPSGASAGSTYGFRINDNRGQFVNAVLNCTVKMTVLIAADDVIATTPLEDADVAVAVTAEEIAPSNVLSLSELDDVGIAKSVAPDDVLSLSQLDDTSLAKSVALADVLSLTQLDDAALIRWIMPGDVLSTTQLDDATLEAPDHFVDSADDVWYDTVDDTWYSLAPAEKYIAPDDVSPIPTLQDAPVAVAVATKEIAPDDVLSLTQLNDAVLIRWVMPGDVLSLSQLGDEALKKAAAIAAGNVLSIPTLGDAPLLPERFIGADNVLSIADLGDAGLVVERFVDGDSVVSNTALGDASLLVKRSIDAGDVISTAQLDDAVVAAVGVVEDIAADDVASSAQLEDADFWAQRLIDADNVVSDAVLNDAVLVRGIFPGDVVSSAQLDNVSILETLRPSDVISQTQLDDAWVWRRWTIAASDVAIVCQLDDVDILESIQAEDVISVAVVENAPLGPFVRALFPADIASLSVVQDIGDILALDYFEDTADDSWVDTVDDWWFPYRTVAPADVAVVATLEDVPFGKLTDIAVGDLSSVVVLDDATVSTEETWDIAPSDVASASVLEDVSFGQVLRHIEVLSALTVVTTLQDAVVVPGIFEFIDDGDFAWVDDLDFVWAPSIAAATLTPDNVISVASLADAPVERKKEVGADNVVITAGLGDAEIAAAPGFSYVAPSDIISASELEDAHIAHPIHPSDVASSADVGDLIWDTNFQKVAFIGPPDVVILSELGQLEGFWLTKRRRRATGLLLGVY